MSIPLTYPNGLRRHYDHTVLLPTPSRLSLYLSTASGGITIIRSYPLPSVLSTLTLTLTLSSLLTLHLYGLRLMLSSLPTLRVYGLACHPHESSASSLYISPTYRLRCSAIVTCRICLIHDPSPDLFVHLLRPPTLLLFTLI